MAAIFSSVRSSQRMPAAGRFARAGRFAIGARFASPEDVVASSTAVPHRRGALLFTEHLPCCAPCNE